MKFIEVFPLFIIFKAKLNFLEENIVKESDSHFFDYLFSSFKNFKFYNGNENKIISETYRVWKDSKNKWIKALPNLDEPLLENLSKSFSENDVFIGNQTNEQAATSIKKFFENGNSSVLKPSVFRQLNSLIRMPDLQTSFHATFESIFFKMGQLDEDATPTTLLTTNRIELISDAERIHEEDLTQEDLNISSKALWLGRTSNLNDDGTVRKWIPTEAWDIATKVYVDTHGGGGGGGDVNADDVKFTNTSATDPNVPLSEVMNVYNERTSTTSNTHVSIDTPDISALDASKMSIYMQTTNVYSQFNITARSEYSSGATQPINKQVLSYTTLDDILNINALPLFGGVYPEEIENIPNSALITKGLYSNLQTPDENVVINDYQGHTITLNDVIKWDSTENYHGVTFNNYVGNDFASATMRITASTDGTQQEIIFADGGQNEVLAFSSKSESEIDVPGTKWRVSNYPITYYNYDVPDDANPKILVDKQYVDKQFQGLGIVDNISVQSISFAHASSDISITPRESDWYQISNVILSKKRVGDGLGRLGLTFDVRRGRGTTTNSDYVFIVLRLNLPTTWYPPSTKYSDHTKIKISTVNTARAGSIGDRFNFGRITYFNINSSAMTLIIPILNWDGTDETVAQFNTTTRRLRPDRLDLEIGYWD